MKAEVHGRRRMVVFKVVNIVIEYPGPTWTWPSAKTMFSWRHLSISPKPPRLRRCLFYGIAAGAEWQMNWTSDLFKMATHPKLPRSTVPGRITRELYSTGNKCERLDSNATPEVDIYRRGIRRIWISRPPANRPEDDDGKQLTDRRVVSSEIFYDDGGIVFVWVSGVVKT